LGKIYQQFAAVQTLFWS